MSGVIFATDWSPSYLAGAFVDGIFVDAGGGVLSELWLQPVNTALIARPNNSTAKDSFFISGVNLDRFPGKHK